jgi:hypothetical protein
LFTDDCPARDHRRHAGEFSHSCRSG